jgi:hypothetical protein
VIPINRNEAELPFVPQGVAANKCDANEAQSKLLLLVTKMPLKKVTA